MKRSVANKKILVICSGNLCRSPYGEYKLKDLLPEFTIHSAGLDVERKRLSGKRADAVAVRVADEFQIDLRRHRAKQLTGEMVEQHDVLLVMDKQHMAAICDCFPNMSDKVFMFTECIDSSCIEDPYKRGDLSFRLAFNQIDDAAEAWMRHWLC
ncbi:MAG: low molecular weight phosphotyrosine protein phosphatase [Vibrio sp.]|uniref:arsenate reductase/protein-tyrosine-phosphatase family protein n=1 Tax=Vibrio sp. TaxID=678 RepID=UPI003A88134F